MDERFDLSLEFSAQLAVLDQAMNLQLFDGDVGELVLRLEDIGRCSLADLRQICQVCKVYFLVWSVPENEINELDCQILLLIVDVRCELVRLVAGDLLLNLLRLHHLGLHLVRLVFSFLLYFRLHLLDFRPSLLQLLLLFLRPLLVSVQFIFYF